MRRRSELDVTARRKRIQFLDLGQCICVTKFQTNVAAWRDNPQIGRTITSAKLKHPVILLESAIRLRVFAALGTLAKIARELFQFVLASFDLDAGKNFSVGRFYNHVDAVRRDLIRPHPDLPWRPTALKNELRNSRDLANAVAKKTDWGRANRKNLSQSLFEIFSGRMQKQFALDESFFVDAEQLFFQTEQKVFRFFNAERWNYAQLVD